jgi:bisphosphoglycerate-dependent phosphoglycerate mutase
MSTHACGDIESVAIPATTSTQPNTSRPNTNQGTPSPANYQKEHKQSKHISKKTAKRQLPLFRTNIADNTTAENQHVTLVLHGFELATPAEIQVELS